MADTCRIVALGGLGEVGKNLTVYECDGSIVVVDAGLAFPRDEHLGVDLVLPDFSYLRENAGAIKAVILTHGHEDHVGSLPYLMREVPIPEIWATRLTLGLVKSKLDEHGLLRAAELREVHPTTRPVSSVRSGSRLSEWRTRFRTPPRSSSRRLPDGSCTRATTSSTTLRSTGSRPTSASLPSSATRVSTFFSATRRTPSVPGSPSRSGSSAKPSGRSSRFARAGSSSPRSRRTCTACSRRSTLPSTSAARSASSAARCARTRTSRGTSATWTCPKGCSCVRRSWRSIPPHEQLILCTGSQGEPLSALTRIAYNDHPAIHVERGDTVIISAKPVPGNELRVHDTINQLAKTGAEVLHQEIAPVHVSGHACAEELRTLLALVRPKAVMPIHGEFRMLAAHGQLAREAGVPAANIILAENGTVVELSREGVRIVDDIKTGCHVRRRSGSGGRARRGVAGPPASLRGRRPDRGGDGRGLGGRRPRAPPS